MKYSLSDKRIFIAGATGMAGSSIMSHILAKYPRARIRASYHKTHPFIKDKRVQYVKGDLTSLEDCRAMARGCGCAIMASALTGGIAFTGTQPWAYIKDNLQMNLQMLEAFQAEKVDRVIYVGSATLYQEAVGRITENILDLNKEPAAGHCGFGWVVRFTEKMCKFAYEKYGMDVVVARVANIFGPFDKFNPAVSHFIPAIIRKAADKKNPFQVWGKGDVARDVIYSEDFARAVVMMAEKKDAGFEVLNIGSGKKTTVDNVVKWALKYAAHKPSEIQYTDKGHSTTALRVLDCSKAARILGWKPLHDPEEGVKRTVEWWINNKDWWKK